MHINGKFFVAEETNIGFGKADIGTEKAEIDKWRVDMLPDISDKTVGQIWDRTDFWKVLCRRSDRFEVNESFGTFEDISGSRSN